MRLQQTLACTALAAALLAPAVHAEPFDRLLPDTTVLYVTIDNVQRTRERYEKSALHALWNDPAMQAFLARPMERWAAEMARIKKREGITPEEIYAVVTGQVALAFPEISLDGKGNLRGHMLVLADIGENERRVRELIEQIEGIQLNRDDVRRTEEEFRGVTIVRYLRADEEEDKRQAAGRDGPQCWYLDGTTLAIAEQVDDLKQILARRGDADSPSLAGHEAYRRVRARLGEEPEVMADVGVASALKALAEAQNPSPRMKTSLTVSGLDAVDAAGVQATLGRAGLTLNLFVSVPGEKSGLLKLFDARNSPLRPPAWVPTDASDVTTMAIDFPALFKEARKIETKLGQMGAIDMGLALMQGMGVDLEKDILGSLGNELTVFSKLPPEGAAPQMIPSFVVALGVKDKPKLEAAVQTLMQVAEGNGVPFESEDYLGVKIKTLRMGFRQLGIAMLPDQFLLATTIEGAKDVIRAYGKEVKGLVAGEDFARGAAVLPQARMAVGFNRFAKAVRQGILGGLLAAGPAAVDMKLFPKAEVIEKYLDIASSAVVNEETGIFYTYVLALKREEAEK